MMNKKQKGIMIIFLLVLAMQIPTTIASSNIIDTQPTNANFNTVKSSDPDYRGKLAISFELLNIPDRTEGTPVILSNTQGIRVNDEASWVGLGWNLGMGAITRSVNIKPDDSEEGVLNNGQEDEYATDNYFVTFGGQGGKIMLDKQTNYIPVMQSFKPWKIKYYDSENDLYQADGGIKKWEITTEDGTTYKFDLISNSQTTHFSEYNYWKNSIHGTCPQPPGPCGDPGICELGDSCSCPECSGQQQCTPECSDGIDNDGDGCIDLEDNDCESQSDTKETGSICKRKPPKDNFEDYGEGNQGLTTINQGPQYDDEPIPPGFLVAPIVPASNNPWPTQGTGCDTTGSPPNQLHYKTTVNVQKEEYLEPYTTTWYLTEIRGPDYIDTNTNGEVDQGDHGQWIKLDYEHQGSETFKSIKRIASHEDKTEGIELTPRCSRALQDHPNWNTDPWWENLSNTNNLDCEYEGGRPYTNKYRFNHYAWTESTVDMNYLKEIITPTHTAKLILGTRNDIRNKANAISAKAKKLNKIELYTNIDNSLIRTAELSYAHELANPEGGSPKLTLKKYRIVGDDETTAFPWTKFYYEHNPDWNPLAIDNYGYYNGITTNTNSRNDDRTPNQEAKAWSLTKIEYPEGGSLEINYEPTTYEYYQDRSTGGTKTGNGIRVKSTTFNDGIETRSTNYEYEECTATLQPHLKRGIFHTFSNIAPSINNYVSCGIIRSIMPGNSGSKETHYWTPKNEPDTALDNHNMPHTSMDWKRGQPTTTKIFTQNGNLVEETNYTYNRTREENSHSYGAAEGLSACQGGQSYACALRGFTEEGESSNDCYGGCYVDDTTCDYTMNANREALNNLGIYCEYLGAAQCEAEEYCYWGAPGIYKCIGTAFDCGAHNEGDCRPEIGCNWVGDEEITGGWVTLDKTTITTDGITLTTIQEHNSENGMPTTIYTTDGNKGKWTKITYAYEQYPDMQQRNMLSQTYKKEIYEDKNLGDELNPKTAANQNGDPLISYTITEYQQVNPGQWRAYRTKEWYDQNQNNIYEATDQWRTTTKNYDEQGNIIKITSPRNKEINYYYGSNNNPCINNNELLKSFKTCVIDAENNQYITEFSNAGEKTAVKDTAGRKTTYTYDALQRLKTITLPGTTIPQKEIEYYYAKDNGGISTTNPNKIITKEKLNDETTIITEHRIDSRGQVRKIAKATNTPKTTHKDIAYTLAGKIKFSTIDYEAQPEGIFKTANEITQMGTEYEYEPSPLARLTKIVPAGSDGTIYSTKVYGKENNYRTQTITDYGNKQTTHYYDAYGNLKKINQEGVIVQYGHNIEGKPTTIISPLNEISTTTYYSTGEVATKDSPERGTETFTYYQDGLLKTTADQRPRTTTHYYDNSGRLTTIDYTNNQDIIYDYDLVSHNAEGKLARVTDETGTRDYYYNEETGRIDYETITIEGETYTINYEYNLAGLRTKITGPTGLTIQYHYDEHGRVNGTNGTAVGGTIKITYTTKNFIETIEYPNGVKTTNHYNDRNLVKAIDTNLQGTPIFKRTYKYDGPQITAGNIQTIYEGIDTNNPGDYSNLNDLFQFQYDDLNRLEQANFDPQGAPGCGIGPNCEDVTFTYDDAGNRLTKNNQVYEYNDPNSKNRMTYDGTYDYEYDAIGNTKIKRHRDLEYETKYNYNDAGKLSRVEMPGGNWQEYKYDSSNRRVIKKEPSGTTHQIYTHDGLLLHEKFYAAS